MAKKVIIDTDPGLDDALALFLALGAPELEVLGLTTVAGNVPLDTATRNAQRVLTLAGYDHLPVVPGAAVPLLRPLQTAGNLHGRDGLGDILPDPEAADPPLVEQWRSPNTPPKPPFPANKAHVAGRAPAFIQEMARKYRHELTIIALAPLTNLALALRGDPELAGQLKEIIVMGGVFTQPGNVTPRAEFNIYVDPEAARVVLQAGVPLRLVGLEIGRQTRLTEKDLAHLPTGRSPRLDFVKKAVEFWSEKDTEGLPLYDPTAVAMAIAPDLFEVTEVFVDVETSGQLTTGETVADFRGRWKKSPNAKVALKIDREAFLARFLRAISSDR